MRSSSESSAHKSGGSSSYVTKFVAGRLRIDIGDGVNTEGEERLEEGVVVAGVGVNTITRLGIGEGVVGTVGSVGTTRTVGC